MCEEKIRKVIMYTLHCTLLRGYLAVELVMLSRFLSSLLLRCKNGNFFLEFHVAAHLQRIPDFDMIPTTCFAFRLIAMIIVSNYEHPVWPHSHCRVDCMSRLQCLFLSKGYDSRKKL